MITDPYKVLGVPDGSSEEVCAAAYKKLAKKYHPDLNKDDPQAAEKMAQINAAYDQIKNSNSYGASYGAQNSYEYYRRRRNASGSSPDYFTSAAQFINNRQFAQALNVLGNIEDRNAQWYYLSAIANMGLGNSRIALSHIQQACAMEPGNITYQTVYSKIRNGVRPNGYSPFGSFSDYTDYEEEPQTEYTFYGGRGCISRFLKFIIIILVIRFIIMFASWFFYGVPSSRDQSKSPTSYSESGSDAEDYFGNSSGEIFNS